MRRNVCGLQWNRIPDFMLRARTWFRWGRTTSREWFSGSNYLDESCFSTWLVFSLFLNTFTDIKRAPKVRVPWIVRNSCDKRGPGFVDKHHGGKGITLWSVQRKLTCDMKCLRRNVVVRSWHTNPLRFRVWWLFNCTSTGRLPKDFIILARDSVLFDTQDCNNFYTNLELEGVHEYF